MRIKKNALAVKIELVNGIFHNSGFGNKICSSTFAFLHLFYAS